MKTLYSLIAIVLIVFLVSGCTPRVPNAVDQTTDTNDDTNNNNNDDLQETDNNDVLRQCDEAINFQVLIDALPTEVNGYIGDEPQGNMLTFNDPSSQQVMRYSTGSVNLEKDDKYIAVTATDTCYIQYLSTAWLGFYEMEGTDGYLKKVTINGNTGWHQYDKSSESYSYNLFVDERVIVSVQGGNGVPDNDVTAAVNAISFSTITAAAN